METQPTFPPIGALIDPDGLQGRPVDKEEYGRLKACLDVLRSSRSVCKSVLETILLAQEKGSRIVDTGNILFEIESELDQIDYLNAPSEVNGLLSHGAGFEALFDEEPRNLTNFLTTLRRGGWLGEFMMRFAASGTDKFPDEITPMVVMTALTMDLSEFEQKATAARELFAKYPKTMKAMLPPEPAPEPPAAVTEQPKQKAAKKERVRK